MITYQVLAEALEQVGRKPNKGQKPAVRAPKEAPLFVVAGPGTGKTATLTMRMLKLVFVDQVEPRGILATTFTRKAAGELRSRILSWGYGVQQYLLEQGALGKIDRLWVERLDINQIRTGTIDSICEELLRDFRDPGMDPPILADEFVASTLLLRDGMFANKARRDQDGDLALLLAGLVGKIRKDGQPYENFYTSEKTELVRTMWDRRHHDQLAWAHFVKGARVPWDKKARRVLTDAMDDYAQALSSRLMVDFAQLEQTVLDRLRAGGFKEFTDALEVVMVDEYQDTNLLQESLYFELAKHCGGALTVVGDDDQSLYRFRGATVELFRDFEQRYQTIGGFQTQPQRVFLNANYRSAQPVIDFVNGYATLDQGYQSARVPGKPPLVNPAAQPAAGLPVLGMFRDDLDDLATDLAHFIGQVTRGRGYRLPSGQVIKIDRAQGGNVGDCALLCSSPKERDFSHNPRLPLVLRDRLRRLPMPIELFNPRGQDFANLDTVRQLGGLLRLCLDPTGDITDKVQKAIGQHARQTLDRWADDMHTWLLSGQADPDLAKYVRHWMQRAPARTGLIWPTHIPCIELLYGLVHWMPELHDDPEGQVFLEVFTRQLGAAEQVSGFKAQVVVDPANPDLERHSVGHLLMYFLAPIADGTAKVDEDLMDSFPRDRLAILSIHQSKGLEFPLVIVDVGSDFRSAHWKNAFKRFPRDPNTPHHLEDLMRQYSPLGRPGRGAVERAFDDLYRQYFVAFSRPQDVLLLVGLTGSHPDDGSIANVATGWTRTGAIPWAGNLPFDDI